MSDGNGSTGAGKTKIGLALAGGGPEGAVYQIGVLRALEEAIEGLDLNNLDIYVGVSAGAFIGANLVNDLTPSQMCRAIVSREPGEHPFVPETFVTPAWREYAKGGKAVPGLLYESVRDFLLQRSNLTLFESLLRLTRALPVGLFDNEPIRAYLEKIYSLKNRTDDFRRLKRRFVVVAADLDSATAVRFGEPGFDHVPISRAVQASTALPGIYSPVEIDGRHYCDGVLLKTVHASAALEAGVGLLLCVNPIVPVDTVRAAQQGLLKSGNLLERGLPTVLSQTLRTLVRSRLTVGMAAYRRKYPAADVVLFEPQPDDYLMFFTNIFSFAERRAVCEHAYSSTRRDLLARYEELAPILARHGLNLRRDVLESERSLWEGVGPGRPVRSTERRAPESGSALARRLDSALDRLERVLAERAAAARESAGPALAPVEIAPEGPEPAAVDTVH
jgi:predicted acylesterase/phospholipase RssA